MARSTSAPQRRSATWRQRSRACGRPARSPMRRLRRSRSPALGAAGTWPAGARRPGWPGGVKRGTAGRGAHHRARAARPGACPALRSAPVRPGGHSPRGGAHPRAAGSASRPSDRAGSSCKRSRSIEPATGRGSQCGASALVASGDCPLERAPRLRHPLLTLGSRARSVRGDRRTELRLGFRITTPRVSTKRNARWSSSSSLCCICACCFQILLRLITPIRRTYTRAGRLSRRSSGGCGTPRRCAIARPATGRTPNVHRLATPRGAGPPSVRASCE